MREQCALPCEDNGSSAPSLLEEETGLMEVVSYSCERTARDLTRLN